MKRLWLCVLVVACGKPKLEYTLDVSEQRPASSPALYDDIADLTPSIVIKGADDGAFAKAFGDAIKKELKPEAGHVIVTLDKTPTSDSGKLKINIGLSGVWWILPQKQDIDATVRITLDYKKQSAAVLGRLVGQQIEAYLDKKRPKNAAVPVAARSPAVSVAVGDQVACVLLQDQSVHCWTVDAPGALAGFIPTKAPVEGALELAANGHAVCARLASEIRCVVRGPTDSRGIIVTKACGITQASALAMGGHHACALVSGGQVRCWDTLHVGNAPADCQPEDSVHATYEIAGVANATQIAMSEEGGCALVAGGKTMCWTNDAKTATPTKLPPAVEALYGFRPCVLQASGQITCEHEKNDANLLLETKVPPGSKVMLQEGYGCALEPDSKVECWGENGNGRLGDGTTTSSAVPRPIFENAVAASISATGGCAVTKDGALMCHGQPNPLPAEASTPKKVTLF